MHNDLKDVGDLQPSDFERYAVWEYALGRETEFGETAVKPVKQLPVNDLGNRVIGVPVRLANGQVVEAMLCNIALRSFRSTREFATIALWVNDRWFRLGRYFDSWRKERGNEGLAGVLGLPVHDVFPIAYDLRRFCVGSPDVLIGTIDEEPSERLTDKERTALLFEK